MAWTTRACRLLARTPGVTVFSCAHRRWASFHSSCRRYADDSPAAPAAAPTRPTARLSHVSSDGRPGMVNVTHKTPTVRKAVARSILLLPPSVTALFVQSSTPGAGGSELHTNKGPVLATAILAGTMAVKHTSMLIPLCHALPMDGVYIRIQHHSHTSALLTDIGVRPLVPDGWGALVVWCNVMCTAKTGAEMEALTGASVAALTLYDMLKAVSHQMVVADTRLLSKEGGKRKVGPGSRTSTTSSGSGGTSTNSHSAAEEEEPE